MMIDPDGLMMIEPQGGRTNKPAVDQFTSWAALCQTVALSKGSYRGFHLCACGTASDNRQWFVGGLLTNSLLLHYVVWHRDEVPAEELEKLARLAAHYGA